MLQPSNILNKKFGKSAIFGYKIDDVDTFFSRVADEFQKLCEDNEILEQKIATLADKIEEYRNDENNLRGILMEAKKLSDSIIAKAKEQASSILSKAEVNAENIVSDAKRQIVKEQNTLLKLQREVNHFKNKIINLYKSHLDLINSLPECDMSDDVSKDIKEPQTKINTKPPDLKTEQPNFDKSTTKQIDLDLDKKKQDDMIEAPNLSEEKYKFIDVDTNQDGDVISKFGILKFGTKHSFENNVKTEKKDKKR